MRDLTATTRVIWLVRTPAEVAQLLERLPGDPVVFADDLERWRALAGRCEAIPKELPHTTAPTLLDAALEAVSVFPGARLVEVKP